MGLVNTVVPLDELERETVAWCREMRRALAALALRLLKASFNAAEDGLTGLQQLSHDATLLFYMTEEGQEGRNAYQRGPHARLLEVPAPALSRGPAHLADGRAAADAAGGDRAGAGRHGGGGRARRDDLRGRRLRRRAARAAILIQIGTNLANDYSDAKRGADTADRLGPVRVTSAGLVAPRRVLFATWLAFAVAVAAGIYLATVAGPVILVVGAALDPRRRPLHRRARGPTATPGSASCSSSSSSAWSRSTAPTTSSSSELDWLPFGLSIPVGLLSTAILVVNNVRDIDTDRRAGKRTLAVRLGPRAHAEALRRRWSAAPTPVLAVGLTAAEGPGVALLALLSAPLAIPPARGRATRTRTAPR